MCFERNYQVKIPSNQIYKNIRLYFFNVIQLILKKHGDYLLKLAVNLVLNKEHITMEGLNQTVAIKAASMNRGLSEKPNFLLNPW